MEFDCAKGGHDAVALPVQNTEAAQQLQHAKRRLRTSKAACMRDWLYAACVYPTVTLDALFVCACVPETLLSRATFNQLCCGCKRVCVA
jgi:hypothetical protein